MARFENRLEVGARIILLTGILSLVSLPVTAQFTNGATTASCVILRDPYIDPQPADTSPYTIVTSPNRYTPGEVMDVILLASPRGTTFEGALLQARAVGSVTPIGVFGIPSFRLANFFDCGGSPNGTVTNNNNVTKTPPITFTWTPPGNQVGDIEIHFVVEQIPRIYWIESLVVSSVPLPFCASQPCANGATCQEIPDGVNCICLPNFVGPTCEIQIIEYESLVDAVFDLDYYLDSGFSSYIFTSIPTNSLLDIYGPGERVDDFQIGSGSAVGFNEFIPGEQGIPHTRISGNAFWVQASVNDANLRPPELRIRIFQFFSPPSTQPQFPPDLLTSVGTFHIVQQLPEGDSIIYVSGVEPENLRYGVGRVPGEGEASQGQLSIRSTLYEPYAWFAVVGPAQTFKVDIELCSSDPCYNGPCGIGFCEEGPKHCLDLTCHKETKTACAACNDQPCTHNGLCGYDTIKRGSFSCACPRPWGGEICDDWRFRDITPGETFDLQLPSFPLFLPIYRNFYTVFNVTEQGRQVRIEDVDGFIAHFGIGPKIKKNDVDLYLQEFVLDETNQFWMELSPNGLNQRVRFVIV